MKNSNKSLIPALLISLAIIFFSLVYAYSNRYMKTEYYDAYGTHYMIFDKWTKTHYLNTTGKKESSIED